MAIAAIIAVAIAAFRSFDSGAQAGATQPRDRLRIALPSVPHAALLHLGIAQGFFEREGLDLDIVPAMHGKAAVESLLEGRADMAAASDVVFALAVLKGAPLSIAANMFTSSNDLAVVARTARIGAPRDLAGKTIGVSRGTAGEYFLWAFMIRYKVSPRSVTIVDLAPAQMGTELEKGTVDAVATWEPFVTMTQAARPDGVVTYHGESAYTETFNLIVPIGFVRGHEHAVEKLVRGLLRSEEYRRTHPEESLRLVAQRLQVDTESLRPLWDDRVLKVDITQSHVIGLEEVSRWAGTRGYAEQPEAKDFTAHLYLDALLAVAPERVTVVR